MRLALWLAVIGNAGVALGACVMDRYAYSLFSVGLGGIALWLAVRAHA